MSNNLGRTETTSAQNQKEVTLNASDGILDAKLTEVFAADFTSGAVTLTSAQFQQAAAVACTNVGSALALNTPQNKGFLFVDNSAGANAVTVTRGSGTVVVEAGENALIYQDGTTNGVKAVSGGSGIALRDFKDSVRVATTAAGTLASDFENGDSIDGVSLVTGDRILIKNQSTASENGIYVVNASGAPTRATDFDGNADVTAGAIVPVTEGTVNEDTLFILTTNDPITVGSTSLSFSTLSAQAEATAVNTQTGTSYTLVLGDANDIVEMNNASANTLTIPPNSSVAFPVGTIISVTQLGAGATTVSADTGVTLNGVSTGSADLSAQYSGVSIYKRDTDAWIIQGDHGGVS